MTASVEIAKASVRRLACEILLKVDTKKSYADILLDHALKAESLTERDRSLLTELVYGTLRWRGKIDAQLSHHLRRPLEQTDGGLRNLLRLTCYQLVFLDRIPDYAAVNEAVALAKTRGGAKAAGFVNGVLRSFLRQANRNIAPNSEDLSLEALAIEYSHPQWLVQCWSEEFGVESAQKLMRANNERSPLVLRVNSLQCVREELLQRFASSGHRRNCRQLLASSNFGAVGRRGGKSARLFRRAFSSARRGLAARRLSFVSFTGRTDPRRLRRAGREKHAYRRADERSRRASGDRQVGAGDREDSPER